MNERSAANDRTVKTRRTALWLLFLGATVGAALDGLHTFSGATWYAAPQFLRSVWWCPPLFAFAGLSIGMGRLMNARVLKHDVVAPTGRAVAITMVLFIVGYGLSGFLPAAWWVKALVLGIFFLVCLAFDFTAPTLLNAAGAALGGLVVEHLLTSYGLFFHRDTQLWGVAGWLPVLYALAAVSVGLLARWLALPPSEPT